MTANELILTQDVSSGRIHRRYRMPGGNTASFEGDNLDQAGDWREVSWDALETAEPGQLCSNCFPVGTSPEPSE